LFEDINGAANQLCSIKALVATFLQSSVLSSVLASYIYLRFFLYLKENALRGRQDSKAVLHLHRS